MTEQEFIKQLSKQKSFQLQGNTKEINWRIGQLNALKRMFVDEYSKFEAALYEDLHKGAFESYTAEINFLIKEIEHSIKHLRLWMKEEEVDTPLYLQPAKSYIKHEPLGTVLIMGAWNYPLQLTLGPLIPAIAAGNCAVIKPPRTAKATTKVITDLLPKYLDNNAYSTLSGTISNDFILAHKWDKIFVTGSGRVGKIVMEAAAKHLTPVTLELGGKSPAIVDSSCNLEVSAKRILQGKFFNAGQTCVAPDYVLLDKSIASDFYKLVPKVLRELLGDDPSQSKDYGRIINEKAWQGLAGLLEGEEILVGGDTDKYSLYISPTILKNVSWDSPIMQDEIFGPLLPIIEIDNIQEGIDQVVLRDKPLALYVFAEDKKVIDRVLRQTSSGGVCVNECLYHLAVPDLPFGGVGPSGMGKYHGKYGFLDFSNAKAILHRETSFDPSLRYPPFSDKKFNQLKKLMNTQLPSCINKSKLFRKLTGMFGPIFIK